MLDMRKLAPGRRVRELGFQPGQLASRVDALHVGAIVLCCGGLSCALWDVEHPWPPLTRCLAHLSPGCDNPNCLQTRTDCPPLRTTAATPTASQILELLPLSHPDPVLATTQGDPTQVSDTNNPTSLTPWVTHNPLPPRPRVV